jgi:hypothetical protein
VTLKNLTRKNLTRKNLTRNNLTYATAAVLFVILLTGVEGRAQQDDVPKVEVGAQFSSLSLDPPALKREVGVGGRVTYNLDSHFAIEAEGNFFPSGSTRGFQPGGSITQAQFGLKVGKRFEKFGVFAKARPGLMSFDGTFKPARIGTQIINGTPFPVYGFTDISRTTHFSADIGGVLEVYASRRVVARFDVGDTIIRYGPHNVLDFSQSPEFFRAPAQVTHNFQFSAGVSFRLHVDDDDEDNAGGSVGVGAHDARPRFEAGGQVTSLTFNPPRFFSGDVVIFGENRPLTKTGFGGRLGFNLWDSVALESEVNYFPTDDEVSTTLVGHITQGQFGVKAGHRFRRFGLFGKARPGLVSFSRALKLVGMTTLTFDGRQFPMGIFENGRRSFFSMDLGGVLELYPSRRTLVRFDAGDTVIKYGSRSVLGFIASQSIVTSPPETRHNFQFSTGFGFRF